jgi:hypothetical protein
MGKTEYDYFRRWIWKKKESNFILFLQKGKKWKRFTTFFQKLSLFSPIFAERKTGHNTVVG